MALTKVTGQVIKNTTDVTVGVLTVTNTLAVGGTVSIGGTLTYEDVTNVDAVGLITARNGIVVGSGITLSKDGDGFFTGIVTATTFVGNLTGDPTGSGANLTNLPAANLTGTLPAISGANLTNLDASDLASGTVPTARLGSGTASSSTFLRGDSTFAAVTSTTINNNADNRVITGSGTANTLNGESTFTYTGSRLGVNISGGTITDVPATSHDTVLIGNSSMTSGGICLEGNGAASGNLGYQMYKGGSFPCARVLFEGSSNELQFHSTSTAAGSAPAAETRKMRLLPNGDVVIDSGNLIVASGKGIDFSATSDASGMASELLDDYEEGTWTPTASNFTISQNYSANYTKIGNVVYIQMYIQASGGSGVSAISIGGLPYTVKAGNYYSYAAGRIGGFCFSRL